MKAPESLKTKGIVMDTFTLDPRCWWIGRIFGRNPLLRRADRVEALVMLVALVVSLATIPIAGLMSGVVYSAHHSRYAEQAHERNAVLATITEIDSSDAMVAQAKWPLTIGERTGPIPLTTAAKVGDHIKTWVDKDGKRVEPPTPTSRAAVDAIATAEATLLIAGFAMTSLVTSTRSRLDRARDAQWERELRCFQKDDGGRTNQR
jgi:hypothetical protein